MSPLGRFSVKLLARHALSPRVSLLRFQAATQPALLWRPGQHLELIHEASDVRLPYSFASAVDRSRPGEFELAQARDSSAILLEQLPLGAELEAEGPRGVFTWQPEPAPRALLIGAGTGVAPLRALIQAELERPAALALTLLAGHRAEPDVLWHEEFRGLARAHPRFRFEPTLSTPPAGWGGRVGRVGQHLAELVRELQAPDAYVCGPSEMVREVCRTLAALGVEVPRIRSEGH